MNRISWASWVRARQSPHDCRKCGIEACGGKGRMTVTRFTIWKPRIITAFCDMEFLAELRYGISISFKCTSVHACSQLKTFSLWCKYQCLALIETLWGWLFIFPHCTFSPSYPSVSTAQATPVWAMSMVLFHYSLFSLGLTDTNRNVNHFQFNYLHSYLGSVELECAAEKCLEPASRQPREWESSF